MPFTLRPALPSDANALAELAARTFHETFAADNRPEDMAAHEAESYGPDQQGREIAAPNIVTILVHAPDENDALVGFSQLRRGPAPACVSGEAPVEVWRFYLAMTHHGKGIAQALMERVHADARQMGARTLWLGVWERNERAKAFYRKCGFTDVGTHVYMVGTDAQTDRIMVQAVAAGHPVAAAPTMYTS